MRRLFTILIAIFAFFTAAAQVEHSIILDQSSFRKVQTDALTGVNIDPIRKDSSRNACARLKIQFANMSRAEVDALVLQFRSNTDIARQEIGYYDNVLILEITAKSSTRFYVQSPDYGQSNEVSLNLEGDCEYEMEAHLNQTFVIAVSTNVEGADVYIDGKMKGRTNAKHSLTVDKVMIGTHTLKLVYGDISAQQQIDVNGSSITFRQDLNVEVERFDVTFNVEPSTATIVIDSNGLELPISNGTFRLKLPKGEHTYQIKADDYNTKQGSFEVTAVTAPQQISLIPKFGWLEVNDKALAGAEVLINGKSVGTAPFKSNNLRSGTYTVSINKSMYKPFEKVVTISDNQTTQFNPTLEANFANITLTAPVDAEIWVNGNKKGNGRWNGPLETGDYTFETRLDKHKASVMSKRITPDQEGQSYQLPAPTPIVGSLVVTTSPSGAKVCLNGKEVGKTPLTLSDVIIGSYTLEVSLQDYTSYTRTVTITDGNTTSINTTLDVAPKYKIGDIVTVNGVKGVVFQTSPVVKIVSVAETITEWGEVRVTTNARDKDNGKANMTKIKSISGWQSKYPAFKWCADLGDGWYLPALNELKAIYNQKDAINKTLSANGFDRLGSKDSYSCIWSSSEFSSYNAYNIYFSSGSVDYDFKYYDNAVRGVLALD